ncbi:MAG: 1,4-alpha-glucan branching protein GlgB [Elusimicrobiota bacterium]|jgi:1,4-alpha-glucan branching enzyme
MLNGLTDENLRLFREGQFLRSYQKLGAHVSSLDGRPTVSFAVWAPNARRVSVIGEFNGWTPETHPMERVNGSGLWQVVLEGAGIGQSYLYAIEPPQGGGFLHKADPFGYYSQIRPETASRIWDLSRYVWSDGEWMGQRGQAQRADHPMSVYEVHLGSWRRRPHENNRWLSYQELAEELPAYVREMGYTHVEFLPLCEHPFDGSWGYQTTGYFAPTSRFGTPDDFRYLIDRLHQAGIGVLMDWVPAHFPIDAHGLGLFDGTHLFEHEDPRLGVHPEWNTLIFNYRSPEVCNYLLSSALFWLDQYHIDGFRVDAVASMLYLDYARKPGEWIPNHHGGRENIEAINFIRRFNETLYREYPDITMIAEESTSWANVSRPTYSGGLGFGAKWDMGWMHDTLEFITRPSEERPSYQNELTFRLMYASSENFLLPLSHDEVGRGQGSLWEQMRGDDWLKMASLRLLYGYQYAQTGKKLLFMGCEFGQRSAWNYEQALEWDRLQDSAHAGLQRWVKDLNQLYRKHSALHELDYEAGGFEWIDANNPQQCVLSFLRKGRAPGDVMLVVCNFLPEERGIYRIGVPYEGQWQELLNSDANDYGGAGRVNGIVQSENQGWNGRPHSIVLRLPPLSILFLQKSFFA